MTKEEITISQKEKKYLTRSTINTVFEGYSL